MSYLSAKHLHKRYRHKTVVKDVSLQVDLGEIVGLLGPNGAGKTTCFYMIMGLIAVDQGQIKLNDQDMTYAAVHQRARHGMGYLAQEPSIFRRLSVQDNILAVLELQKLKKTERRQRCQALLKRFGLAHLAQQAAISLSGGERRRLEIARSLASQPKIILLDEPFAGIDPISVTDIQSLVKELAQEGIAILITDHNVRETLSICDRAYILAQGQVLTQGQPQQILAHEQVRKIYLGQDFKL